MPAADKTASAHHRNAGENGNDYFFIVVRALKGTAVRWSFSGLPACLSFFSR
jgi:hypothetical protein